MRQEEKPKRPTPPRQQTTAAASVVWAGRWSLRAWTYYNYDPSLSSLYCLMVIFNEGLGAKSILYKTETKTYTGLIKICQTQEPQKQLYCPQGSGSVSRSNNSSTHSPSFFHILCSNSLSRRHLMVFSLMDKYKRRNRNFS